MPSSILATIMTRLLNLVIIVVVLTSCPAGGCDPSTPGDIPSLEDLMKDPCFKSAGFSLSVLDLNADSMIFAHGSKLALPPASTLKVLTTAAALKSLGPDFRFFTEIGFEGHVKTDTLFGDLIIKGGGDPTLSSSYFPIPLDRNAFNRIRYALKKEGIHVITGDIVGDASFYPVSNIPSTWPYQDLGNYYGAFCAGLNYHDNQYFLTFKQEPTPGDQVTQLKIRPPVPYLKIESFVHSGRRGSGDNAYIMGAPFQNNRFVTGTIPPGQGDFTIKGSVPDPAMFFVSALKTNLQANDMKVEGKAVSTYLPQKNLLQALDTLWSPPLSKIIAITNQQSVNLFAEGIGQYLSSTMNSIMNSKADWLSAYWTDQGVDMHSAHFSDFSGLAPDNAISSETMVRILRNIYLSSEGQRKHILASPGRRGSIWHYENHAYKVAGKRKDLR